MHDFNNILDGILASASLIQRTERVAPAVAERLTDICMAAERAVTLNRSLLAYLGRASKRLELLDLSALARDTARMVSTLLPKSIVLRLSATPASPKIFGDPGQIGQVVLNLITNAAEAIGDRPGEVVVETSAVELSGELATGRAVPGPPRPGSYARLRVRDDGAGMAPDVLGRIFDPFFTTKATGRGLGLAAVVGIVRDHGGVLVVETAPRAGTTFDVLLPRAPHDAVAPKRPAASARAVAPRGPVLLAEDEAPLRRVSKMILEEAGFQVELAEDGVSAVAAFEASPARFAAVVIDQSMPRLRGDLAASKMRASARRADRARDRLPRGRAGDRRRGAARQAVSRGAAGRGGAGGDRGEGRGGGGGASRRAGRGAGGGAAVKGGRGGFPETP